ncbi:hypothetical protein QKU48_gp0200 [Fadolivirus algeromassiliense]|jgi:hypothetical protein|uniref:Uncharacterized protein n=1 Tax=Fadolivirus FV1/VV64 TaxID=3070911 RepID=A0A7D3R1A7_9VIRU|nr:hypothetical protein QKU48_gp0200 [Fadolivirus algeromassiliense]QKF93658.1 hypothetical protein Fadolivirus_1_200 [Fadolivirus FV1/VV64]
MDTEEYNSTVEEIKAIENTILKKGKHHWYDLTGKLIVNGNKPNDTKGKLMEIIKNNKSKYINKKVCHVSVVFYYDQDLFLDKTMGPFEIQAVVYDVKEIRGKLLLHLSDEKGSLIRMFYTLADMKNYNILHMKKFAKLALDEELETTLLKYYHYKDLKKQLTVKSNKN